MDQLTARRQEKELRDAQRQATKELCGAVEEIDPNQTAPIAAVVLNPELLKRLLDLPADVRIFGIDITEHGEPVLLLEWQKLPPIRPGQPIPQLLPTWRNVTTEEGLDLRSWQWTQHDNPHTFGWVDPSESSSAYHEMGAVPLTMGNLPQVAQASAASPDGSAGTPDP